MSAGLFEFMAASEADARQTVNKALHLAQARVETKLGGFLSKASNVDEYEARFSMVADDFIGIVAVACKEVGHDNPGAIAVSLKDHYRPVAKGDEAKFPWQKDDDDDGDVEEAEDKRETDESDDFDSKGKKKDASVEAGGQAVSPLGRSAEAYNPSDQDDDKQKTVSCPECGGEGTTNGGTKCQRCKGAGKINDWGPSNADSTDDADTIDHLFNSKVASGQCPHCGGPSTMLGQLGHTVHYRCRNCGADHSSEYAEEQPGELDEFADQLGDSLLGGGAPEAPRWSNIILSDDKKQDNTGLGDVDGPAMDKSKGTVEKYKEKSKTWPNIEKDPIEPIKAVNDDPLEEIGDIKSETLPTATGEGDSGFADGGVSKGPHTDTWSGKDGLTDPVKSETLEKAARWSNIVAVEAD